MCESMVCDGLEGMHGSVSGLVVRYSAAGTRGELLYLVTCNGRKKTIILQLGMEMMDNYYALVRS